MKNWFFGKNKDEGPAWPVDEEGNPSPEAAAAIFPDVQMNAELAQNMLRAYGIPARTVYPGDGVLGRVVLGASGYGAVVVVPAELLEDAQALLAQDAGDEAETEFESSETK